MWGENGLKLKFSLQTISGLTHKEKERDCTLREIEPRAYLPFDLDFESHPDCTERDRWRTQSPSTSHPSTSLFDFDFKSHPDCTERDR